ncbi:MAG: putative repair protein [candidate division TM6 bacterium GW2011_GWF2_32_72]|nr:MAG: putative repair protein [candidate division TM6 bacterium GW2011_GWF2_32_72]
MNKINELEKLKQMYINCTSCPLAKLGRTQVVFGCGNPNAKLMLIGEAPGKNEDIQGEPFVGRAGKLLAQILESCGINRKDIYITNIAKCRPPHNRTPLPEESKACKTLILEKQIEIIQPKIICTLGSCATQAILGRPVQITKERGQTIKTNLGLILPTLHPAYILRNKTKYKLLAEDIESAIKFSKS